MSIAEKVGQDLTAAMKARDEVRLSTLRMAKAALKNREIEKREALDDAEAIRVLQGLVKQREDAAQQFDQGARPELARKERAEAEILRGYLPQEASAGEIDAAVARAVEETGAASAKDMGKVMKAALQALQAGGKPVDGKKVNEAVRKRLGA